MKEAFFAAADGAYRPLEQSRGYWKRDSLHGRCVVGLLGYEMERLHGVPGFVPARLSVDMHSLAPFAPVRIETKLVREGNRLRLVEAVMMADGVEQARAQLLLLRAGEAPPGRTWAPEPWQVPSPDSITPYPDPAGVRMFDWRPISGDLRTFGPRQVWSREYHALVEGVELTPWARIALHADFASPWTHAGDAGIQYINCDVVLHIHRLPVGEWIGMEATGHEASQAIAVGHSRVYDEEGPLGHVSITALANRKRRP
ncbi:acyl-CoA thioesterase domain-containing protein [Sphingobium sp. Sx8-8]|uniref:thioesterase family protein n=1 Tax=Sphingobium sp. Sx8-8 TaxID=2933617 RepID=UPI001F589EBB|nr:acyl-CoA thioesterase domain-containing protein [Sphingobium sp. Sx8-8]